MTDPSKHQYDVIIVGAGPAGATLGYELSQKGVDVLILEKENLPRYKACAGGITVKTANALDLDISPVVHQTAYGVKVTYKKKDFTKRYDKPLIYMVMRDEFDYLLVQRAQNAGAVVSDNQNVYRLHMTSDGAEVFTSKGTFTSKILVGADGAYSIVANTLEMMKDVNHSIGMQAEIPVSEEILAEWDSLIGLDVGIVRGGYSWVFPKKDHLSVGIGCSIEKAKNLKAWYKKALSLLDLENHDGSLMLRSHFLPVRKKGMDIQRQRSLLLGDAAGLLDPLTGEGIYNAIRSARIAAPVIMQSLEDSYVDLSGYQQAVDKELMPELTAARAISRIYTWFPGLYFDSVKSSDRLWRAHCRVLRGEETYITIKKRMGIFQFLFNLLAW